MKNFICHDEADKWQEAYLLVLREKYQLFSRKMLNADITIGIELEFHIVPINSETPDFTSWQIILNHLLSVLNFTKTAFDYNNNCIKGELSGDVISYEASLAIIEFSLAPAADLHSLATKASFLQQKTEQILQQYKLCLLPLGVNPFAWRHKIAWINNEYYQGRNYLFQHFLPDNAYSFSNSMTFICSNQVHIDIGLVDLSRYLNTVNRLSWVKALLFANSPDVIKNSSCLCVRDWLWQDSAFAYHIDNVGVVDQEYDNWQEVFWRELHTTIFYVIRDGQYIFFKPIRLLDFLQLQSLSGWQITAEKITTAVIMPTISDINFARSYHDAAITTKGTVEIRSECAQPFADTMAVAAFHLGLQCNINKIIDYLDSKQNAILATHSFNQWRQKAIILGYDIGRELNLDLNTFIYQLLVLVKEGLRYRDKQEEVFIDCLFARLDRRTMPALTYLNNLKQGQDLVKAARYD